VTTMLVINSNSKAIMTMRLTTTMGVEDKIAHHVHDTVMLLTMSFRPICFFLCIVFKVFVRKFTFNFLLRYIEQWNFVSCYLTTLKLWEDRKYLVLKDFRWLVSCSIYLRLLVHDKLFHLLGVVSVIR